MEGKNPRFDKNLRSRLDRLYEGFDFKSSAAADPIKFPMRYGEKKDVEVSAFIASAFAYGRLECFMPVVDKLLSVMGESPSAFLADFDAGEKAELFSGINYRFNGSDDVLCLLHIVGGVLRKYGSIEGAFMRGYGTGDKNTASALSAMIGLFLETDTSPVYGRNIRPPGLTQFFPSPSKGSACKRANLFLRWMVRDKDVDLGIWKGIPKDALIIPLDTHIARVSRGMGLTGRKANDLKTAVEVTESLRRINSDDPLKYDFPLCHNGISKGRGKCL